MVIDGGVIALVIMLILLAISIGVFIVLLRGANVPSSDAKRESTSASDEGISSGVREAVATLREKLPGRKPDESVPWILLIGEPLAGKTLLADYLASGTNGLPAQGGGVRWNFLDGGVLIDVPGNFILKIDGTNAKDERWTRLIRSLVRRRPARPIDGIVLTVPAIELLNSSEIQLVQRSALANAIRSRLDAAQMLLGLVVPVYVVVTKCDQIRGFGSFCWETDPDMDNDIFGWSNPNTLESAFAPDWIDEAFDSIGQGVLRQQLRVFGSRETSQTSDELFVFPLEFDAMRAPLRSFLTQIFRETSYVDSNFLRGIYFCGDSSVGVNRFAKIRIRVPPEFAGRPSRVLTPGAEAPASSTPTLLALNPTMPAAALATPPQRRLVFAKHLFDFKIFLESKIARPVTRIRLTRNRTLLGFQVAFVIFIVVFTVGTASAWRRLRDLRDHRFSQILDSLAESVPSRNASVVTTPSVQTAFNLVESLEELELNGFGSFFLPASWGDPLDQRITSALTEAFGRVVFPAIASGLEQNGNALVGNCTAAPVPDQGQPDAESFLQKVTFTNDVQYLSLDQFLTRYSALEQAFDTYEKLRRPGTGSYNDLDSLFQYLLGKGFADPGRVGKSSYYQRALLDASAPSITHIAAIRQCAEQRTSALVNNFYESWFGNNPLLRRTNDLADEISDLQDGQIRSKDELSSIAQQIRQLDAEVTGSNLSWLTQPDFELAQYPALKTLPAKKFTSPELVKSATPKGEVALQTLKRQLLSSTSGSDAILEQRGADVHLSASVLSLELGLSGLLSQDFMTTDAGGLVSPAALMWNAAALSQTGQLRDAYDKFVRERLPLLPPSLRLPLQRIAAQNLNAAVTATVARSQSLPATNDDATTLLEIRSFKDAAPLLTRIQQTLPGASATSRVDFNPVLARQSVALAQKLNSDLDANPAYPHSASGLRKWSGSTPLSYSFFGVDSRDSLEEFLANQRERMHSLAIDYAEPLAAYIQAQGLQHAAAFDRWPAIIRDEKDYDSKKPGNPIAALETFIRTDLDKITPANACRSVDANARSNDYFVEIQSQLQRAAVAECSEFTMQTYSSELAAFFNSKLAGRFPFGPLPSGSSVRQADPHDVGEFLSRIDQLGPGLVSFVAQKPRYADVLSFLNQAEAVRQMFAGGLADGSLYTDVAVEFRVNRSAERSADEIIDWKFQSGDQTVSYPATGNGVRWDYGDPVHLALRYAKDSPDVPRPGGTDSDSRVEGRTVDWDYSGGWSLFELLARHSGQSSDFGETAEAVPGTLRFVIPTMPDTSGAKARTPTSTVGQTRVYIRLMMRIPGSKEAREVPVASFPVQAPLPRSETGSTE